tara:strand:- start:228 stop:2543 length:2316 start_codon:yes stop_codon:yes gene_type:complete
VAASQEQKVDFLLKKIGYTASKTGIAEDETGISGTKKAPFAEPIPSPLTLPGANVWAQSNQIPTTPPVATTPIVRVYKTGSAQQLTFDSTVADNRSFVARETVGEVTSTVVGDWVDTQFGADYIVKVYRGDPNSGGVQLSAAGSGSNDTWFFDYSAGVLNFNGTNVPSGITTTNIFIEGYRYTGIKGVTGVAQTFTNLEISGITTFNGAVDMNSTLDVDGDTQLDDLNVAGVATFSNAVDINSTLDVDGDTQLDDLNVAGVATFSSGIDANGTLDVDGDTQLDDLTVTGVATFTNTVDLNAGLDVDGQLDVDELVVTGVSTFSNAVDVNSTLDVDGDTQLDDLNVAGVATFSSLVDANNRLDVVGGANIDQLNITGISTLQKNVGFAQSAFFQNNKQLFFGNSLRIFSRTDGAEVDTSLQNPKGDIEIQGGQINIGNIGTGLTITGTYAGFTTSKVTLFSSGAKKLETVGTGVSVFNELNLAKTGIGTYTGTIRFGTTGGGFSYGDLGNSLDIINQHNGNFNYYLDGGGSGAGPEGHFNWINGAGNDPLMTLRNSGDLGIGISLPSAKLHVKGAVYVTGISTFDSQIRAGAGVSGNLTGNVEGTVTGKLLGNVVATSGISTFVDTLNSGFAEFSSNGVGIGTTASEQALSINESAGARVFVTKSGKVGIKSSEEIPGLDVVVGGFAAVGAIGVGVSVTRPLQAAVDFGDAGKNLSGGAERRGYMIPPKMTTSERDHQTAMPPGALIYNTTTNQLQIYTDAWVGIGTTTLAS